MPPPETPGRHVQPSPHFYPSLQFSPDLYHFPMSGPATAPALPQQKLFWDPLDTTTNQQFQDPFGHDHGTFSSMFPSPGLDSHFPATDEFSERPYDLPGPSSTSADHDNVDAFLDGPTLQTSFAASPRPAPPRKEDPSQFLSSPARRFGGSDASTATVLPNIWDKPAYHHQMEESKRERDIERGRKFKAKRLSGAFPLAEAPHRPVSPARDLRPGLKRSLTHTGVGARFHLRHQSHVSFADSVSSLGISSNKGIRGGRSSPSKAKRDSAPSTSTSTRPNKRTSLSFTIDEDGRAKTVITPIDDSNSHLMDLDEDSSLESDSGSDDQLEPRFPRSSYNSFTFSDQEEPLYHSYHSRTQQRAHSKTSSYSPYTSSISAPKPAALAQTTAGSKLRYSNLEGGPTFQDSDEMDESDAIEIGDAQQALRAIIRERPRSRSTQDGSASCQGSISMSQYNSSPPIQQTNYGNFNASPTTITDPDAITPSTDRESLGSNNSTRCICNSTSSDGHLMIQW